MIKGGDDLDLYKFSTYIYIYMYTYIPLVSSKYRLHTQRDECRCQMSNMGSFTILRAKSDTAGTVVPYTES